MKKIMAMALLLVVAGCKGKTGQNGTNGANGVPGLNGTVMTAYSGLMSSAGTWWWSVPEMVTTSLVTTLYAEQGMGNTWVELGAPETTGTIPSCLVDYSAKKVWYFNVSAQSRYKIIVVNQE